MAKKGHVPWNKGISTKALGKSRPISKKVEHVCPICNTIFLDYPGNQRITCSKNCRTISMVNSVKGPKHHKWKGGLATPNRLERIKFRVEVQKKVLARDNYTCVICQSYGGYLQVDHIKKWSDYPELRFDMSNCRTLCMSCHYYITFNKKMPKGTLWGHNLTQRIKP